ncbi:MAG TPA: hypothetical protein VGM06_23195 [Polyangiaceae bacterium]|jgi:hypothetical protein
MLSRAAFASILGSPRNAHHPKAQAGPPNAPAPPAEAAGPRDNETHVLEPEGQPVSPPKTGRETS